MTLQQPPPTPGFIPGREGGATRDCGGRATGLPAGRGRQRIARRLTAAVLLFSLPVILALASIQIYLDYRSELETLRLATAAIEETHLEALAHSVWVIDEELIHIHLGGLIRHRYMELAVVEAPDGRVWSVGSSTAVRRFTREFPLRYEFGGRELDLGVLRVEANLDALHTEVFHRAVIIVAQSGVLILLVAVLVLAVCQYLVTRHLVTLAGYTEHLDPARPPPPLQLNRRGFLAGKSDELDLLAAALNTMRANLSAYLRDRERAERAIADNERKFRRLLESTRTVPWELDVATQRFTYVGPQAERIFGRPISAWTDFETWASWILADDRSDAVETCRAAVRKGEDHEFLYRMSHPNGSVRWVRNIVAVVQGLEGPERLVGFLHDVTERQQGEEERLHLAEQLRQAQKMESIGTLAGGIAHDFNNILSAILGYTELAKIELPPDSPAQPSLDKVLTAGDRARDLVRHILAFSRKTEREIGPVNLSLVTKEALQLLRASIPTTVEFREQIQFHRATVLGDTTQLHQVIVNLCTNAAQAMEAEGGTLTVRLGDVFLDAQMLADLPNLTPGPYARLAVSDTGPGIPPDVQTRIFEPYYTTKDVGKGSGMGLAVVHGIVQSHGGMIRVKSAMGIGTEFEVFFPSLGPESLEEPEAADFDLPTGTERILLVDDEEALAWMSAAQLESLGYAVTTMTDSLAALETFRDDPSRFDLIISDQSMPRLAGGDLAAALLKIRPNLPILLYTGYSTQIDADKARELGIRGFAMKPMAMAEMATFVRRLLDETPPHPPKP